MMNFWRNKCWFLFLYLGLTACGDHFETVVDFEIPEQESLIATTAILQSNFGSSQVLISHTVGLNDSAPVQILSEAVIELTTINQTLRDWKMDHSALFSTSALDYDGLPGSIAHITVSADGLPTSSASIIVPDTPIVNEVYFGLRKSFDIDGFRRDLLKVTIADQKDAKNFYGIEVFRVRTSQLDSMIVRDTNRVYLRPDGLVTEGSAPLILSDATFDGQESVIRAETNGSLVSPNDQVLVIITTYTESYFQYLRSLSLYYDAQDNPFAEPVDLYSNMENGVGIFTINQVRDFVAEIDP